MNGNMGPSSNEGPSDASWSSWSNLGSCNGICKTREEVVPKKFRSRTCIPEKFGGKNCSFLEDQARMNQQPLHKEEHECFELPDCPRNATLGPWGEWSPCTQTCYQENGTIPRTQRTRPCQEASLSSDQSLNDGIVTCKDLQEVNKESKDCDINVCPGDSVLLITGGWTARGIERTASTEVFPSCSSPPPLPSTRVVHQTFKTSDPTPLIASCGGWAGGRATATASCLVLDLENQRWDESRMGSLTTPRAYGAVVELKQGVLFLGGLYGSGAETTSDFLATGSLQWQQ